MRFASEVEQPFTLKLSRELANRIRPQHGEWMDIDALVQRDLDGSIKDGELIDVHPLDTEGDAFEAWSGWLTKVRPELTDSNLILEDREGD